MELRTMLEMGKSRPSCVRSKASTESITHGGYNQTFEGSSPDRDRHEQLGIPDGVAIPTTCTCKRNNNTSGGGYVIHHGEQRFYSRVFAVGKTKRTLKAWSFVANRTAMRGFCLRDIAKVSIEPNDTARSGDSRRNAGESLPGW